MSKTNTVIIGATSVKSVFKISIIMSLVISIALVTFSMLMCAGMYLMGFDELCEYVMLAVLNIHFTIVNILMIDLIGVVLIFVCVPVLSVLSVWLSNLALALSGGIVMKIEELKSDDT